jgi:AbrB family looped-hinge helix DNA binding protein
MPVVKVGRSRQVVIPKEIWDRLGLEPGDYFEVELEEGRIVFVPKKLMGREELWYWSKGGQAEMDRALREIEEGQAKEFDNVDDLIDDLKA